MAHTRALSRNNTTCDTARRVRCRSFRALSASVCGSASERTTQHTQNAIERRLDAIVSMAKMKKRNGGGHLKLVDGRDSAKAIKTIGRKKGHIEATHNAFLKKKLRSTQWEILGGDGVEAGIGS